MTTAELKLDAVSFQAWAGALHGFGWLRDFRRPGRRHGAAHEPLAGGLVARTPWRDPRPALAAGGGQPAAVHWLLCGHFLVDGADGRFAHDSCSPSPAMPLICSMPHGWRRRACRGCARCSALPMPPNACPTAMRGIRARCRISVACLDAQLFADGGHASRNPSQLFLLLRQITVLWHFLRALDPERAALLQPYLDRMAPMLRFFRHGDGGLALFHGGAEENPAQLDLVLELSEAKGKPLSSASLSRFERAAAKRGLLLLDAGLPPSPLLAGARPHRGLLACESATARTA